MREMLKKMRISLATKNRNKKEGKKDGGGSDQKREGAVEKDGKR